MNCSEHKDQAYLMLSGDFSLHSRIIIQKQLF